jgi:hypothetical protein
VGDSERQSMLRIVKRAGGLAQESLLTCRFVPLLGRHGWPDRLPNAVQGSAAR